MIEIAIAVGGAVAVGAWILSLVRDGAALRGSWRNAALDAGLQVMTEKSWGPHGVTALDGQRRVLIEDITNKQGPGTRIVIEGDSGITLSLESLASAVEKSIGRGEVALGDEAFDKEVYVRGSPEVVRAVLDAPLREQLRPLLRGWIRVDAGGIHGLEGAFSLSDGDLRAEFRGGWHDALLTGMPEVLTHLVALARKLDKPGDLAARIAANTRDEPEWRVRRENLLTLAHGYPEHPATRDALERGCQDDSPEVRLQAAIALKQAGLDVLLEMSTSRPVSDPFAVRAVQALGADIPVEHARRLLRAALDTGRVEMARACLVSLGRAGGPEALAIVAQVLADERGEVAAGAAQALGVSGAAAAEAPLLEALDRASLEIRAAAAEALGRVGSAAAVPFLEEAAARESADGGLKRAVRRSIAEIQSRLHGASPGQVSLADSEAGAGQLSLAGENASGRLSIPKPDDPASG